MTEIRVRRLMKRRERVNTVQRWLSTSSYGCVSDSFYVYPLFKQTLPCVCACVCVRTCVCVRVCVVFVLLLQRPRHILEACCRGVVAVPRHTSEGDQTDGKWGKEGTEMRKRRISCRLKLLTPTRAHLFMLYHS